MILLEEYGLTSFTGPMNWWSLLKGEIELEFESKSERPQIVKEVFIPTNAAIPNLLGLFSPGAGALTPALGCADLSYLPQTVLRI